ncbi:ABC transporter substrate-binding protein [Rhodobium gokarnense]|uniref:Glycine betaine/proline transport system substrate-binding protein n=1 Tax=Rhodobium gokarnense TaxID=364296 RepID=A0ABT3H6I7_9HYPH|nr:ABC transporter substrate-binding protein [Rhodobium gokarnense]MCW2306005.1 glycine betaine/proline transport system substrate-binding protein [Rhodobium gokarnense]
MNSLKTSVFGAVAAAALISASAAPASATECGTDDKITIAEMTWLSASTLAHVTQKILADGYGCNAEVVPGDTVPTATSMLTKGEPTIAPEMWVSTAQAIWDKMMDKGNVYKAGDIFGSGGQEGWWIPDYTAKEHPEIKSINDLKDNWELFADVANPDKGRLYGCPPGWGCEIITNNLFKALNLGETYELFSPGSGANLKASIARQVTRKKPMVAYYWGPTAVIGKYNLVRLDMPEHDADKFKCLTDKNCADPQVTGWAVGEVAVAATTELKEKAPNVAEFLSKMQVPNDDISKVLAWGDENKASPAETAAYFLKNNEAIWTAWVPEDVAAKVKESL